jgi:hypothetical protein
MGNVKWFCATLVLLAFLGNGCSRSKQSAELDALDQSYRTGVLSKNGYEAKKSVLESQSDALQSLDKALSSGVITQADYDAKKSRLIAEADKLAALERARRAGIFTQEEYQAKKASLLAVDAPSAVLSQPDPGSTRQTSVVASSPNLRNVVAASFSKPASTLATEGMKTINASEGGTIVYGQIQGQNTEAGAMGAILHSLHNQFGDRPQVGRLFQVHGTESVAAFFSVGKQGKSSGQIAGLIIATKVTDNRVEAAMVSDDAARFPKSLGPMMKTLVATWHPLAAAGNAASRSTLSAAARPVTLHQITLSDHSASISLPDNWKIVPSMSMKGTIVASGPRDESAELGITFLAGDTNNPNVQRTLQVLRSGGLRNTSYAKGPYYPYGGDLSKAFVYFMQDVRRKAGLPQASYSFSNVTPFPAAQGRCVHMVGTADLGDRKTRELNAVYCATPPNRFGSWMSQAYTTMAPVQVAAEERATLGAILQSFNVDMRVVQGQSFAIAKPAIDRIHAIGVASAKQADDAHERNQIHNSSVYQQWDNNDKRSQEFENYQLGYSVISDVGNNVHGTFWNEDAAALVESNPDKFEYVSAPNYWKGVDY